VRPIVLQKNASGVPPGCLQKKYEKKSNFFFDIHRKYGECGIPQSEQTKPKGEANALAPDADRSQK
jgi:hypothetical protein